MNQSQQHVNEQKSIHCTKNGIDGKTGKKTMTSHCMQL